MEIEDGRGSNASPASDNACPLMGYESYFSDFHEESELKLCIQSSCHGDKYSNVVVGNKGFENKEESNGNALDHANLFELQGAFIKEDLKIVDEEAMRIIAEDDQDDFPGLSPLRGDCVTRSSNIGTSVEAEYLMFDDGRDCNGCDNFLFSSRVDVHVPLVGVDGDISRQKDGFYCSPSSSKCLHASKISYGSSVDMKIRNLSNVESQRLNFDCCSGNVANLADRTTKDKRLLRLQDRSSLLLQHSSMMKETYQFNNFVCVPEIQNADEEISGVPHIEQANFSAMERTISEKHSRPSAFACCSIGAADFGVERNNFDSFNRMSTPFNNNECCIEAKKAVGALANSSSIEIVRRTNPKRSASLRSSLDDRKSNLLSPILQRDGRKRRRKIKASASRALITPRMFASIKRKIRNSHRQARVSLWGTMESLLTNFKQREDPIKHDIESIAVKKRRSKIAGPVANRRKRTAALKNKLSGLSFNKIPFSSSKSIPPVLPDTEAFLKNGVEQSMTTSDGHIASETSSTKFIIKQNSLEKWYTVSSNARGGQQGERDMDSTLTQETSADNLLSECHGVSSRVKLNFVAETVDDKQPLNSGSSPDSDIYHPAIDSGILTVEGSAFIKQEPKVKDGLPCAEGPFTELPVDSLPSLEKQVQQCENPRWNWKILQNQTKKVKETRDKKGKKEKKYNKKGQVNEHSFILSDSYCAEESLDCEGKLNEVKIDSLCCNCCFKDKGTCEKGGKCSNSVRKHCKKGSKSEMFLTHSSVSGTSYFGNSNNCIEIQRKTEGTKFHLQNDDNEQLEALLPSDYINERQMHPSTIKSLRKNKSGCTFSIKPRKKFIYGRHKGSIRKSDKVRKDNVVPKENESLGFSSETACETAAIDTLIKDASNEVTTSYFSEFSAIEMHKVLLKQTSLSGKLAWALCDDCQKWRCVPDELVNVIEKRRWTCKDNADEAFADCTIPQEKTDDDINQDLGIFNDEYYSTELHSHGKLAPLGLSAASQTMWTRIKSNLFLHRNRRTLNIDEIMVCHCKPPLNGSLGCDEECLNRMLNIECVKGTCPCGSLCSNQQFQKRKYTKFKWIKCGKKGYGLQLEENVSRGKFLIEYVGEVLDIPTYEARLRHYASRGQKHFYFMTLNGGEVIDACTKGNLGRYVNHSCDPNCRTEKWMVNGEVCIGLFAIRDIKKGEEITFDYNYVRVFGAAAKKCVCGSAECRGYIGGDPSSSEVIVQDDSDAEDLEPVMIDEDGNVELGVAESDSIATDAKVANPESLERNDTKWTPTMSEQGVCVENHAAIFSGSSELDLTNSLMQSLDSAESKNNLYRISEGSPLQDLSLSIESDQNFCEVANESPPSSPAFVPLPPGQLSERSEHRLNTSLQSDRTAHEQVMDNAARISSENFDPFMHRSSSAAFESVKAVGHLKIKRSRVNIRSAASGKTKKVSTAISTRHIEGVEEKLNELLDEDGGILRQKDAAKGYLKLLVVTAAAGDETRGSMSQSVRNLSLILDAILKTKSRMVLVDIINKNGLQMLHNMMKQNRENFNRIPILRKLLKVLEFLAEKEILTRDHIYATPPCCGMESFKESMLKLMKHRDSQVQIIARNFADQWIPRNIIRRAEPFENHSRHNWCPSYAGASQQVSTSASFSENNSRTTEITESRKRKTRWDHPSDISPVPVQDIMLAGIQMLVEPISEACVSKCVDEDGEDDDDDEMPPGFESPFVDECLPTTCVNAPPEVAIGRPQERYLRHLPVSYGVPIDLMLHLGTPVSKIEIGDRINPSWRVAPAMPFMPFPPLPPYPRSEPCPPFANGFHEKTFHCWGGRGRFYPKHSGNGRRLFRPPCQGDRRCGSRWT